MQSLDDTNDAIPNLLQKLADLMSQLAEDQRIDGRTFFQYDEELGTLRTVQKQLEQGAAFVSRKRNTFAPINALPPELLVTIFAISLDYNPSMVSCEHETLIPVCHYWNYLVNSTPSLWMKIRKTPGISNARVMHSLEQSKDHPIEIMCDISSRHMWESHQDAFLSAIFPHAHRWRKASLHLGGDGQDLGPMATISTPLLEPISLSTEDSIRSAQDKPLNIFGGRQPPRLRELFLARIPVPWSSKFLCNLMVLGISQIQYLAPSLDQLLGVLSACPCLESLIVREVTFAGGANPISLNAVHMAALGRLELEDMPSEIMNLLLAAIHAPNCKFGTLSCFVPGDPLENLFTSDTSHFFHHMRSGAAAASIICEPSYFRLVWEGSWRIAVVVDDLRVAKGTLNWLHALQERNSPVVPLDVTIRDRDPLIVEGILAVMANTEGLQRVAFGYKTPVAGALRLLATGSLVEDSTQGPFPELMEVWIEESINDDDWEYLVGMLRGRRGEIDVRDGVQTLKPLRKVRLGRNWYPGDRSSGKISNFSQIYWPNRVEKVRRLLGPEGELIWYGRFVTEDGAFDDWPAPLEWS